jgi:RNA polymerase sigma-B factor
VRAPRSVVELSGSLERREPGLAPPLSLSRTSDGSSELTAALVLDAPYEACDDRLLLAVGFRTLTERERRILHLRYFAGLSQAEIASELGLSQVHVSRLLRSSLERLNAALAVRQPRPASSTVAS